MGAGGAGKRVLPTNELARSVQFESRKILGQKQRASKCRTRFGLEVLDRWRTGSVGLIAGTEVRQHEVRDRPSLRSAGNPFSVAVARASTRFDRDVARISRLMDNELRLICPGIEALRAIVIAGHDDRIPGLGRQQKVARAEHATVVHEVLARLQLLPDWATGRAACSERVEVEATRPVYAGQAIRVTRHSVR